MIINKYVKNVRKNIIISGFTFIKNGITLGYPVVESINSIVPLCDEIIVNVGFDDPGLKNDDGTYQLLRDHFYTKNKKIRIIRSYWDPRSIKKGSGLILSEQTNIALRECKGKYCQYIQADEVIHENDLSLIEEGINCMEKETNIEGLVFNFLHFYGNVDIVKHTRNTYRREVRTIRNYMGIKSWLDAQGFRKSNNSKIHSRLIAARIFHYGWAREQMIMKKKISLMDGLYHNDSNDSNGNEKISPFEYRRIWGLYPFRDTHPQIMSDWISKHYNPVDILKLRIKFEWKNIGLAVSDLFEKMTGIRMGEYKGYKLF
ncbi:MAG: hypothetical protein HQK53_00590 [Oligoflexia bacterium]|nr:hypothetical protein [Oligoflexia bacterium]